MEISDRVKYAKEMEDKAQEGFNISKELLKLANSELRCALSLERQIKNGEIIEGKNKWKEE